MLLMVKNSCCSYFLFYLDVPWISKSETVMLNEILFMLAKTSTNNADKPPLSIAEIKHRVERFRNAGMSTCIT